MSIHTPGPWSVERSRTGHLTEICAGAKDESGERTVFVASASLGVDDGAEEEANARLIAAAPDLLAACKAIQVALDSDADSNLPHGERMELRDVIAKAEGDQ